MALEILGLAHLAVLTLLYHLIPHTRLLVVALAVSTVTLPPDFPEALVVAVAALHYNVLAAGPECRGKGMLAVVVDTAKRVSRAEAEAAQVRKDKVLYTALVYPVHRLAMAALEFMLMLRGLLPLQLVLIADITLVEGAVDALPVLLVLAVLAVAGQAH